MKGNRVEIFIIFLLLVYIFSPEIANAYVGPGLGAGAIGVFLGIIGSIFIALFAIIWYPLKRLIKKSKKTTSESSDSVNQ